MIVAVYMASGARLLLGLKRAMLFVASQTTVPVTAVAPGPVTLKVVAVSVVESIPSLNVAMIFPLIGTVVAVFTGIVEFTVGAVVSVVRHDSKLHEKLLASGLPVVSLAEVVIVAVYMASGARLLLGLKRAMLFVASQTTVPVTGLMPVTRKVAVVIVKGSIALLKAAVIFLLMGSQSNKLAGFTELTWGAPPAPGVTGAALATLAACSRPHPPKNIISPTRSVKPRP